MTIISAHNSRLSQRAQRTTAPPISWLMSKALANPETISLAAGFVDQQSLPVEIVQELTQRILSVPEAGRKALQYGPPAGAFELRKVLAERLEKRGLEAPVSPDHLVVTNGSQQLLYMLTDVLIDAGDIVLVEDPTYFVYTGVLEGVGANTIGVPTDDDGMIPEALEERLESIKRAGQLPRVKLLYLMTYFQNPKGTSHSWERRQKLWDIIERYSTSENYIYILEDAAYVDLRYEGPEIPFMKSLDKHNERVVLALTFSKAFSPGLRLGYGYLPQELIDPVLNQKGNHDFGSGHFSQTIAYNALITGFFDEHGQRLRERYREKRDLMLKVLHEEFPKDVKFVEPLGGLYVWTTLPEGVSTGPEGRFWEKALEYGVLYVPGRYCYAQEPGVTKPDNQLRLCYGSIEVEPMIQGLRRLADATRACL